jgi:hypothetical protein
MKKKLIIFSGMILLALLLTTGTFAYTYTNSNTGLPLLASGDFATYQVSPNQPDWESVLPKTISEILVPNGCGDETQLPTQYPNCNQHWDKVDDQPNPDELSTYVSTQGSSNWKRDLYQLSDYAIANGTEPINSITVYYRFAAANSGFTVSAKPAIKTNGEVSEGQVTTSAVTSFTTMSWDLTSNPVTEKAWTWDEINDLQAGIDMKGYSTSRAAICTQVYVQVNYKSSAIGGELPHGDLFVVTPDATYTGDLLVKVYITNIADLLKAYKFLNMKIYVANSLEAGDSPNYQILSVENGVAIFNIIGGSASSYKVQLIGGSYSLVSDNPDKWGTGWTITPDFYCEVSQR